ncbi:chemotaxis protein CheW [Hyphomicrobium sp. LHD-15]|uniref:hybrid sensor histidine kinase/response regulator n=1 Tax=Hyphomicrobium sp. LHD-15 TaxID=3072142 RepID=UPI00280DE224|nr:chemotaxis protein CheW [Hyphomicrobium sp. LHD-15]MDQ8699104.1 chemotaxis protein CheW [Hyphomicrobium sp. LHD-15]
MDELLRDFLTETTEHIEGAETQLVHFERNPSDASLITSIFRLVHTIKGTSSFLGLERLERVGHAAESVMGMLRDGVPPTQHSVTLILAAIDRIKTIIEEIGAHGSEPPGDDAAIIDALEAYYAAGSEAAAAAASAEADTKPSVAAAPVVTAAPVVEAAPAHPVAAAPAPEPVAVSKEAPKSEASSAAQPKENRAQGGSTANQESIRVSVDTIERMMQLVSELVLSRNQLLELARHREDDSIKTPLQHLSTLTSDLQDAVMRARMQPVGRIYANLPRLVRELSTSLGKSIDLITEGADTELDRQLIEVIRDPLTHLIRNCADHGIERPEERLAKGKPERGEIRVSAAHEAGQITIDISDDGKGLDTERIKKKILSQGLTTEQDLRNMSNEEIYRFIFEPGFSTAQVVSNVSGRGVGMDVVRSNIEAIGGSVTLSSVEGKGSRFSLRIPLTLAIAPALIIEVAGQRFALPQTSVVEAVSLGKNYKDLIQDVQNALVLKLREEVIPAVELREVVGLGADAAKEESDKLAVVMRVGTDSFCIIVDSVADIQEIVVKPLSASLAHLKVFSGHTILGDGSVVLILDPAGIAGNLGIEKSTEKKRDQARDQSAAERRRLVMFRAGAGASKVLPLSLVSRIEMVETSRIESSDGRLMVLLQGRLMPIVPISPEIDMSKPSYPVLVVATENRSIGLMADEIVDILEEKLEIQLASANSELVGSAEIRGEAVELVDVSHFIRMADPPGKSSTAPQRILFAADDQLVRDMLCPAISAAGYNLVAVTIPADINELLNQMSSFDAVILDGDAPALSAPYFLRALKDRKDAARTPAIGLSRNPTNRSSRSATENGMIALLSKHDRHALLETLAYALDAAADAKAMSVELAA